MNVELFAAFLLAALVIQFTPGPACCSSSPRD
jgi:threonine/homoserine/homoserine lactone efflux protein